MTISEIFDRIVISRIKKSLGTVCTVNPGSVSSSNRVCDVTSLDGQQFFNVRLTAGTTAGLQFMILPADNSAVIIQPISDNDFYVSQYSVVAKIMAGDGSLGGMVEVINLTTKLNNLESLLNKIVNSVNTWVPVAGDGGAALKTLITAAAPVALTNTLRGDIENTNFTQGV